MPLLEDDLMGGEAGRNVSRFLGHDFHELGEKQMGCSETYGICWSSAQLGAQELHGDHSLTQRSIQSREPGSQLEATEQPVLVLSQVAI